MLALTAALLLVFNRHTGLDTTALYFFGVYVLCMCSWWAFNSDRTVRWMLVVLGLIAAALAIDFRGRLMVAGALALALVCLHDVVWPKGWLLASCWLHLGKQSYSALPHYLCSVPAGECRSDPPVARPPLAQLIALLNCQKS